LSLTQTGTNDGTIGWNFSLANSFTQYLAAGETVTAVYTITVTDDSGTSNNTATQDVTIVITGTNDAPVITDGPDSVGLTVTGSGLTTSGSLTVTDVDVSDVVNASVQSVSVGGTGSGTVPGSLSNATLASLLSVSPTQILNGTQTTNTLNWSFNSGSENFSFLAAGETLVLTYTVQATDDDGSPLNDTETVTITITGGNNTPDVLIGAGDSAAETLTETNGTLTSTGTLSVNDSNVTDIVTSSVIGVVASGTTTGLGSNNAALLSMLTSTANVWTIRKHRAS
jgi:VCBS repeat-containing protein